MRKVKAFLSQLGCAIKNTQYPSTDVWGYWEHTFKDGNCVYLHWRTLKNYVTGNKKI